MVFCFNCKFWDLKRKVSKPDGSIMHKGKCTNEKVKEFLGKDTTTFSTNYCWWGIEK